MKLSWDKTIYGLTNQAPWRKQPGATTDQLNIRNAIDKGATTRNGTNWIANLNHVIPTNLTINDIAFYPFNGDMICVWSNGMAIINTLTGAPRTIYDNTGGYLYLSGAVSKESFRFAAEGRSVFVLNREKTTTLKNSDTYIIVGKVDFFNDLPPSATVGKYYEVQFDQGSIPKGFYKRVLVSGKLDWEYVAASNQPNASWVLTTMPHRLLRNDNGTYTFDTFDFTDRKSGNDATNPAPSWAGYKIEDICFFYGRLFIFGRGVVSSSSSRDRGSFFSYNISTPSDVSNPINQILSSADAGPVLYSSKVANDLFIQCERGQLLFTSGQDQLTNVNGQDVMIASYKPKSIKPAFDSGTCVMLDSFGVCREFSVNANGFVSPSGDLNSQTLKLFQNKTVYGMYRFGNQTYVNTNNGVYVHELFPDGKGSYISSWTRFDFNSPGSTENQVFNIAEQNGYISMLIKNETKGFILVHYVHGEETPVSEFEIAPTLDFRSFGYGIFVPERNVTYYSYLSDEDENIIVKSSNGQEYIPTTITPLYIEIDGNHASEKVCVGIKYESKLEFEKFYAGASNYRSVMSSATIYYKDTSTFATEWYNTKTNETIDSEIYNTQEIGTESSELTNLQTGDITIPIMQDAKDLGFRIKKTGSTPMTISALSFDVNYSDPLGVR